MTSANRRDLRSYKRIICNQQLHENFDIDGFKMSKMINLNVSGFKGKTFPIIISEVS